MALNNIQDKYTIHIPGMVNPNYNYKRSTKVREKDWLLSFRFYEQKSNFFNLREGHIIIYKLG